VSRPTSTLTTEAALGTGDGKAQQAQTNPRVGPGAQGPSLYQAAQQAAAGAQMQQPGAQARQGQAQAQGQLLAQAGGAKAPAVSGLQAGATASHGTTAGAEAGTTAPGSTSNTQQAQAAQANQAAAAQRTLPNQRAVFDTITVNITKAISAGLDRIHIQLKPPTLGRIEVQLEMAQDGRISAVVTADNRDTYEMLKNDSRSLERALQEAGFQTDSGSLTFNLRSHEDQGGEGSKATAGAGGSADAEDGTGEDGDLPAAEVGNLYAGMRGRGRVDIRA